MMKRKPIEKGETKMKVWKVLACLSLSIYISGVDLPVLVASEGNDEHTVFLSHMDGDLGESSHPIQLHGSPILDAKQMKWNGSISLDGKRDYISIPAHSNWMFGSEDFTIETWMLFRDLSDSQDVIGQREDGDRQWRLYKTNTDTLVFYWMSDGIEQVRLGSEALQWQRDAWYHIALVRHNETFLLFRDGELIAESTYTGSLSNPNDRLKIGAFGTGVSATSFFKGNFDEFRISKGVARYRHAFSDALPEEPFVRDEATVLSLPFDGDRAAGTDEKKNIRFQKSTLIVPESMWDGAIYFEGKDTYLAVSDSDDWCFAGNDFTVDFWVRLEDFVEGQTALIAQWHYSDKQKRSWVVYVNTNNILACCSVDDVNNYYANFASDIALKPKQWYHIAFLRDGKYHKLFVNGRFGGMIEVTGKTMKNSRMELQIGYKMNRVHEFSGFIDEVRISKGIARWRDDFSGQLRKAPYGEVPVPTSEDSDEEDN
jgi:hypothetical protein